MFWQGKDTLTALHLLVNTAYTNKKRILFWIGAGVSSWCEYPLWLPLAKQLHHDYKKYEQTYDIKQANTLIDSKDLPTFFGYCKSVDPQRYRQMLVDTFATKHITPVYQRFIGAIRAFENPKIITTNVEETLEHNLPDANTIQYHDLERVPKLISRVWN